MDDKKNNRHDASALLGISGHLLGVLLVSTSVAFLLLPPETLYEALSFGARTPELRADTLEYIAYILGLGTAIWSLLALCWGATRSRKRQQTTRVVRLSRGSVMTETIVVLPVFLLLIFGFTQLTVNLTAGMLANIAGYQASRAVWLWHPEAQAGRMGVSSGEEVTRAKIAAAAVMAPVASGDYRNIGGAALSSLPAQAKAARAGFAQSQTYIDLPDIAVSGMSVGMESEQTLFNTLGSSNFLTRSMRNFTRAYYTTQIEVINESGRLGARMTYQHFNSMPLVGPIFDTNTSSLNQFGIPDAPSEANGYRAGFYTVFTRSYTFKAQQAQPNNKPPDNNMFGDPPDFGAGDVNGEITNNTGGF